jgi:predicted metal-dependent hydrolase
MDQGSTDRRTAAALRRGAALFDDGHFWEAHEAWEEAWLEEDGQVRLFLQGLIQVAAGYHKATVQLQPNGCVKLLRSGLDKLEPLPPEFLGVSLGRLIARLVANHPRPSLPGPLRVLRVAVRRPILRRLRRHADPRSRRMSALRRTR